MKKIVVTGGSGKAGRAAIRELIDYDYEVLNVDFTRPKENLTPFRLVDLTDYGQTFVALHGADAVVHLAANPAPDSNPQDGENRFRNNTLSTYNVFNAAVALGLRRVVWASSETTLGLPFERQKPAYSPIDEEHPLYPESSYALSKVVSEEMARQFNRWSGVPFIGLRFSNIMEGPEDYQRFPTFWDNPHKRKGNVWGYIDSHDVGSVCRLSLEADISTAEAFIIAAGDTVMKTPSAKLMETVYPDVPVRGSLDTYESLLSTKKAQRMLGFVPHFSWRDYLEE
ncbi:MAG: NAD(P)-dependent oxidoreductase [Anaerolineae bacterium]|nr:NAD(P)-dependent oxidoreductase [Anaerolineae bacterium]